MLGREAYQNPWMLSEVDAQCYQQPEANFTRFDIIEQLLPYIEKELSEGQSLSYITRHILGLFHGQPGGKQFRRHLSENAHKPDASIQILLEAAAMVKSQLDRQAARLLALNSVS
jgi:tRNA-dihydrouridine synthase A